MFKPGQGILTYLKNEGKSIDLPLDFLRQFQEFEKILQSDLDSYEGGPKEVTFAMQSFTKIEIMSIALMMSGEFPAVLRCHDDLMRLFKKDQTFADGVTLMSWILFNFPAMPGGRTIAEEVLIQSLELKSTIGTFVEEAVRSRLGLYETIEDASERCRLKELFTGENIVLSHSLGGTPKGSLVVCRVLTIMDKQWAFGATPYFPSSKKSVMEGMVRNKMSLFFGDRDEVNSYRTMMRMAGPYWFSILTDNHEIDILNPDHYKCYYQ